jgi:site-specific DNA-cytosine methylase
MIEQRRLKNKNYNVIESNPTNPKFISNKIETAINIWNDLLQRLEGKKVWINNLINKHQSNFNKLIKTLRTLEGSIDESFSETSNIFNYYIQLRPSGLRVKSSNYFPTLVRSGTLPIIDPYKRYIAIKESTRLQSFPNDYKFLIDNDTYKQLGNSVNVIRATLFLSN